MRQARAAYVLPIRSASLAGLDELTAYLRALRGVQLIIVDGSPSAIFDEHARRWGGFATHVPLDPLIPGLNGKGRGVLTGLRLAAYDKLIVADDDIRYDAASLDEVIRALDDYAVVRPQNYFSPQAWHTVLDEARSLINRVSGGDWPGTLGVRRHALADGYNADVLFENYELVRYIVAAGGRELVADDCFVPRRPPSTRHFWSQRVRQAYDEFARPPRMLAALALLPAIGAAVALGRGRIVLAGALVAIAVAEAGRRKHGARRYFPVAASFAAPLWLAERAVCAWLALYARLRHGGVRYAGRTIRDAASVKPSRVRLPA
ncbi:MAG: glycosyltransferase family 2 protein [Candidatus Eremiobacteraeota bacterium]|nr:glycosyltransferase family 2 protein [Candidatus Eremiobacteraeota bacterium]